MTESLAIVALYAGLNALILVALTVNIGPRRVGQKALNPGDPSAVSAGLVAWAGANPRPEITLSAIADHIDHISRVAGRAHVGLGSDFDGVPFLPIGLDGVEDYPALLVEMARRGWSDAELAGLAGGNLLRALRQAERVAARD